MGDQSYREKRKEYRARHAVIGLCLKCNEKVFMGLYCFDHHIKLRMMLKKHTTGRLSKEEAEKREQLITLLHGRFSKIQGGAKLNEYPDYHIKLAQKLRYELDIGWGGIEGLYKLGNLIKDLDRKAIQLREDT